MRSAAAQILETALALQRAPGERFRLRERPLPADLLHVLEVASGSPQALSKAAAELGQDDATLLDAARFYLEQVLFAAPDATAYRILGVLPEADTDLIRTHHRWLQRWLHPDRAQAGDASVYATRVNQAWAILRNPDTRHQYDVRLAEARLAGASAPLPATTVRHWEEGAPAHAGGRARYLLAAALVACAVLAVLVVRHEQGPQPWTPSEASDAGVAITADADTPLLDDRDLGILPEAFARNIEPAPSLPPPPTRARGSDTPAQTIAAGQVAPVSGQLAEPTRQSLMERPIISRAATSQLAVATGYAPATEVELPTPSRSIPPAIEVDVTPRPVSAALPPAESSPDTTAVLLGRMQSAQQRYAALTTYLAARPGSTPSWPDPETQQAADQVRERMAVHGMLMFEPPSWQLQLDNARLNVDYRCQDCRLRRGRLDVELVWREGAWRVQGIELAPSA